MDELEISGKRYLSSKYAAKQHKYHADYIGQLIRAKKVVGQKVGRSWYVEATSLDEYLKSERGASVEAPAAQKIVEQKAAERVVEKVEEILQPKVVEAISDRVIEKIEKEVLEKTKQVSQPQAEQKIKLSVADEIPVQKTTGLTYVEDNEPFIPVLNSHVHTMYSDAPEVVSERQYVEEQSEEVEQEIKNEELQPKVGKKISTLMFVGAVACALVVIASTLVASSIIVEEGKPASVIYTIK